jgi:hypothetical protein
MDPLTIVRVCFDDGATQCVLAGDVRWQSNDDVTWPEVDGRRVTVL